MRCLPIWILGLLLGFPQALTLDAQSTNGWGVGSTNLDKLQHFWTAMEQGNGPVNVLAFGDSMSVGYVSIQHHLFLRLQDQFGLGGVGYSDGFWGIWPTFLGGSDWEPGRTWSAPNAHWWADHFRLPPGGAIYWTNITVWFAPGTVVCDQVGVYWVAQPGGGQFTLSISTNGGPTGEIWSPPLALLDGYAPTPVGRYTNVSVQRLPYWLRVDGLSGTNIILAPELLDRSSRGVNVAFMDRPGASLDDIFSLSTNVLYPILSALNPQLVVFHMKEGAEATPQSAW